MFSRLSSIVLMIAILLVTGALSALTAMRFAIRGREVAVPALVGKSEEEARQVLLQDGLLLRVSSKRFSADVPAGQIIDQTPPSGTHLKANSSVRVLLSLGERQYAVPDLVGTSLRAAQLTLAQRDLMLGNTVYTYTAEGEAATVVDQYPLPGTLEGEDPSVSVLISLGPPVQYYVMPDLIGRPAELVASRARSEGFRVGPLTYRRYAGSEPGIVIQQTPQAGYRLSQTDTIYLDVSQ